MHPFRGCFNRRRDLEIPVLRIRARNRPRRPDQANLIEQDAEAIGFHMRL
jgi:hypothetical protein